MKNNFYVKAAFDSNGNSYSTSTCGEACYSKYGYSNETNTAYYRMNTTYYSALPSTLTTMIASTRWHLGDDGVNNTTHSYDANTLYSYIISSNSVYGNYYKDAIIGLPYVTDYMYSVLASDCVRTIKGATYDSTATCYNNNWMWKVINAGSTHAWTINNVRYYTSSNGYYARVYYINYSNGELSQAYASGSYNLFPTFHLKNQTYYSKGNGSSSNPYYISL